MNIWSCHCFCLFRRTGWMQLRKKKKKKCFQWNIWCQWEMSSQQQNTSDKWKGFNLLSHALQLLHMCVKKKGLNFVSINFYEKKWHFWRKENPNNFFIQFFSYFSYFFSYKYVYSNSLELLFEYHWENDKKKDKQTKPHANHRNIHKKEIE